ncbi:MAG: type II secretion system F family protein [Armatimonadota bacterium]|jgi:type IV pilus assembly protein PilC|nr:type II secretion system F family protein [Armatimonadota bacterium]MDR7459041.1 type II secretion system F family protein [Armatimonadota bacterium]MDR7480141.1 type II secretion system F family protein [Armatimonadota bacterium]MDR7488882.1 type II secretion system F family protein [Armatimonadota bacterium]MDR7490344.1 type II secretion system F family protein [Armatimonadota bacterium]
MAIYRYSAKDPSGRVIAGTIEADSDAAVVERLRDMGFFITNLEKQAPRRELGDLLQGLFGVGLKDLAIFSRQFSTMVNSGLSLVRTLSILEQQTANKKLREITAQVRLDVESGKPLSEALGRHPRVFSSLYVNMVKAGETGGVLDEVLNRIATFLEKEQELRSKIRAAMVYPALLTAAALGGLMFMTIVILPQFQNLFKELGGDASLPLPTQVAMAVSVTLRTYWYVFLGAIAAAVYGLRRYLRTPAGRARYDRLKLSLPVLGDLNRKIVVSRFSRTLGTLIASGVPIMQALEVVAKAIDNTVIGEAVDAVRNSIREGQSIAIPLQFSGVFPPMVVQMTKVGEETGALESMLQKVADFYDVEIETTVQSLTSMLEPMLIIFMGVVVGAMVISLYLPIFSLATGGGIK